MKKIFSFALFLLVSTIGFGQGYVNKQPVKKAPVKYTVTPEGDTIKKKSKYFIATNSGISKTPVGIRIGILDRKGGYIGARFGKGSIYEAEGLGTTQVVTVKQGTLFSISAGLIFPIYAKNENFRVHALAGIGCGKWFERLTKNGQTVGGEFETGLMISSARFLISIGGTALTGDGNSPLTGLTFGAGYRFNK